MCQRAKGKDSAPSSAPEVLTSYFWPTVCPDQVCRESGFGSRLIVTQLAFNLSLDSCCCYSSFTEGDILPLLFAEFPLRKRRLQSSENPSEFNVWPDQSLLKRITPILTPLLQPSSLSICWWCFGNSCTTSQFSIRSFYVWQYLRCSSTYNFWKYKKLLRVIKLTVCFLI